MSPSVWGILFYVFFSVFLLGISNAALRLSLSNFDTDALPSRKERKQGKLETNQNGLIPSHRW